MRPAAPDAGLRSPAREHFPVGPKDQARAMALTTTAVVLTHTKVEDGAGGTSWRWVPGEEFPARLDERGSNASDVLIQEQVNETASHLVSAPPDVALTTSDRIRIDDNDWAVLSIAHVTDEVVQRIEVRAA